MTGNLTINTVDVVILLILLVVMTLAVRTIFGFFKKD